MKLRSVYRVLRKCIFVSYQKNAEQDDNIRHEYSFKNIKMFEYSGKY